MNTTKNARILGRCLLAFFMAIAPRAFSADPVINIEWSSKNKDQARRIHEFTSRIYSGDLKPEQMINDLTKLTNLLTDSSFSQLPGMDEFQVVARAVYAWRTTNFEGTRSQQSEQRNSTETEAGGRTTVLGPLVDVEVKYRRIINELKSKSASESSKIQSDGHKIEDFREAWHQSYRLLLTSLAKHGFSPPVSERDLIGVWTWRKSGKKMGAGFTFTLKRDHSMQVKFKPDHPENWPGGTKITGALVDEGRGRWAIDYNRLTIEVEEVWIFAKWTEEKAAWIDDEVIKSVSSDTIVLETPKDNELKRSSVR